MAGRGIPLIIPFPLDPLRQDIRNVLHPHAGERFVVPALDLDHASRAGAGGDLGARVPDVSDLLLQDRDGELSPRSRDIVS